MNTESALPSRPAAAESVVLVHGLWLHGVAMFWLRHHLQQAGFDCRCFSYPSVRRGIDTNAQALAGFVRAIEAARIHLLGHSLGGLVILRLLERERDPRLGRAVLLGSPCTGSHAGAALLRHALTRPLVGRSIADWQRLAQPRPAPPIEVGIIAGSHGVGLGRVVPSLPRPNDGVVCVAETRLAGAHDHLVLPVAHTQMLFSAECARQSARFLRQGRFDQGSGHS